jgi:hypothetical protein
MDKHAGEDSTQRNPPLKSIISINWQILSVPDQLTAEWLQTAVRAIGFRAHRMSIENGIDNLHKKPGTHPNFVTIGNNV